MDDKKVTINWGQSGIDMPPTEAEIDTVTKLIQAKAIKANVVSLHIRKKIYEWLKNSVNNGYIKVVSEYAYPDDVWILIGIDEATTMTKYKSI